MKNKGFSLIELMIVVVILSTILAISVVNYRIFLIQFSVNQAAEEATIALRTTQQKAITLGLKSGIYVYSKSEYWVFAEPMSTADLIPYTSLIAATALPGPAPTAPSYLPRQAPSDSDVLWKVPLENGVEIVFPDVGCAIYSTAETVHELQNWKITTVYIYPSTVQGQTVMILSGGNNIFGIRYKTVFVDFNGKFIAVDYNTPGGPIAYNPDTGKYVYAQSGGPYMPGNSPTPAVTPYYQTNAPLVPMPGNPGGQPVSSPGSNMPNNSPSPMPSKPNNSPAGSPGPGPTNPDHELNHPGATNPITGANDNRPGGAGTLIPGSEVYDTNGNLIQASFLNPDGTTSTYYNTSGSGSNNQPAPYNGPTDPAGNPILPGMTNIPPVNQTPFPPAQPIPSQPVPLPMPYPINLVPPQPNNSPMPQQPIPQPSVSPMPQQPTPQPTISFPINLVPQPRKTSSESK